MLLFANAEANAFANAEANAFSPSAKNKPQGNSSPLLRERTAFLGLGMSTIFLGGLAVFLRFLLSCLGGSTGFAGGFGAGSRLFL